MNQKPQRRTVRAGQLDRVLTEQEVHNQKMQQAVVRAYHAEIVAPLMLRIRRLETPWWKRLANRVRGSA